MVALLFEPFSTGGNPILPRGLRCGRNDWTAGKGTDFMTCNMMIRYDEMMRIKILCTSEQELNCSYSLVIINPRGSFLVVTFLLKVFSYLIQSIHEKALKICTLI